MEPFLSPRTLSAGGELSAWGEDCSAFVSVCILYVYFKCLNDKVGIYLFSRTRQCNFLISQDSVNCEMPNYWDGETVDINSYVALHYKVALCCSIRTSMARRQSFACM